MVFPRICFPIACFSIALCLVAGCGGPADVATSEPSVVTAAVASSSQDQQPLTSPPAELSPPTRHDADDPDSKGNVPQVADSNLNPTPVAPPPSFERTQDSDDPTAPLIAQAKTNAGSELNNGREGAPSDPPAKPATPTNPPVEPTAKTSPERPATPKTGGASLKDHDENGDGQIGLDEWPRDQLAKFKQLDANGDGFVTAKELAAGESSSSVKPKSKAKKLEGSESADADGA